MASEDPEAVLERIRLRFKNLTIDFSKTKEFKAIAESIPDEIRVRTRLGKDVNNNKLKSLDPKYVKKREKHSNKLSKFTTPGRSNLTATGQMLDAIKSIVKGTSIIIELDDTRKRELDGSSPRNGNNDILRFNEEKGRSFFGLAKFQTNKLKRIIRKELIQLFSTRSGRT